jgi:ParB-like chromosome segregation protein Spo0J
MKLVKLKVGEITVGKRQRKDLGDIDSLVASIRERGLIQPIAVRPDYTLVAGGRRYAAVQKLGLESVPVVVLDGSDDLLEWLKKERDENTCRKDYTPLEIAAIGEQLEALEKPAAAERKAQAKGEARGAKQAGVSSGKFPEETGQTRDKVASAFGLSGKTYEKIKKVAEVAKADPATFGPIAEEMDRTGNVEGAYRRMQKAKAEKEAPPPPTQEFLESISPDWSVDQGDCLDWLAAQEPDSIDLVFGSPPYEMARLYMEDGADPGIARRTDEWVDWMVKVYKAALRCCKGLVAFVVEGQTKDYRWTASPVLLMAALYREGITLRKPPIYHRVGIPGSGGPDWLRNDYEFVICATRGGPLPWSDNTAMGTPPKFEPGGDPTHRRQDGSRVNGEGDGVGYATMEERNNVGPHRARQRAGRVYVPPEIANPGNVITCVAGGGNMGDSLCHENEAPFPERIAEFFVRSFCPVGGTVCDPFSGSGTTGKMAVQWKRKFRGCDVRKSQVDISRRRLAYVQQLLPMEGLV